MRRAAGAVLVLMVLVISPTGASAVSPTGGSGRGGIAPGFVKGREHEVRIRPVLARVPAEPEKLKRSAIAAGEAAIATCDPEQVTALGKQVPTTPRDGDDPAACVVVETKDKGNDRVLLGPAAITGSEIGSVFPREARKKRLKIELGLTARGNTGWTFFSAAQPDVDLALTLDGEVFELVTPTLAANGVSTSFRLGGKKGYAKQDAAELRSLLEFATQEEIIELAREASMSRRSLELFASNQPAIEEKGSFASDCPLPEADAAFVLGCYDASAHTIAVLRIDRADIVAGMPVTAAHELLHAVYDSLPAKKRNQVDTMIDEFLAATPQPELDEVLALYTESERADELHSILGTEIRTLSPELERYYRPYFEDRSTVVDLNDAFASVFDVLESRYDTLNFELTALDGQIRGVESELNTAGSEADRLGAEIDSLRAQGRIDESNRLVGPQNAAVDRANSLLGQYNALVAQYNAKVDEINAISTSLGELYRSVTAVPITG